MKYDEYLNLDTLLSLQKPHTDETSELMFIVAHQSSELWFKVLISELNNERDVVNLKCIIRIFNHLNALWDIIATMSYEDYEKFRSTLGTASGKQSEQYIEMERLLKELRKSLVWKWQVCTEEEELLDVENAFKKWQFSHMKAVERIIGNRPGTGGTSGVDYLKRAVDKPLYADTKYEWKGW